MPQTPEAIETTKIRKKIISDVDRALQDSASAMEVSPDRVQLTKAANRFLDEHEFAAQEKVLSKTLKELVRSTREFQDQLERTAKLQRTR